MKSCTELVAVVVLVVVLSSVQAIPTIPNPSVTGVEVNEYVDRVLVEVRRYLTQQGLEPFPLPDTVRGFSCKDFLGITWRGEASLTEGKLYGLLSLERSGDVDISYDDMLVTASGRLRLPHMQFRYLFATTFMNIGPRGKALSLADGISLNFRFVLSLPTLEATFETMEIADVGDMDISILGLGPPLDFMTEVISNLVLDVCKARILDLVQPKVTSLVSDVLRNITMGSSVPTSIPVNPGIPTSLPVPSLPLTVPPLLPLP